jgi:GT2 family glycosyltransferase
MNSLVMAIVVWNNADDAIECAESLLDQTLDATEVVFIDNDSEPSCKARLEEFMQKKKSLKLHLHETGKNDGTAGGFTAAATWARAHNFKYVGALNADAIASKNWCKLLVDELESHSNSGIATGTMLSRDGTTIDSTGDFYTTWGLPGPRNRDDTVKHIPKNAEYVFGATGGGFIARTSMYDTVGYYDSAMFMYYEDVDFSFRAQLAGYKVRYNPKALAYHKRGASADTVPGLAVYNTFKNLPILFTKNVPLKLWPTIYPRFIVTYCLILMSAIKNSYGWQAVKGNLMSWRYLFHMFSQRIEIQRSKRVSTKYISSIILHDIPPDQTGLRKFRKFFTGRA